MRNYNVKLIFASFFLLVLVLPSFVFAQTATSSDSTATSAAPVVTKAPLEDITVSAMIIDAPNSKAKDILEYEITIKNNSARKYDLYAIVEDLTAAGTTLFTDPKNFDKATSLGRWIRIKRGVVEIEPGATAVIPLTIEVNLSALPGVYHAAITFSAGSNATEAQRNAAASNKSKVLINLPVAEVVVEKIEVRRFASDKNVYFKLPAVFQVELFNLGNMNITPGGSINIYDRQGHEVDTLLFNNEHKALTQNSGGNFSLEWKPSKAVGKYRARLNVEYGNQFQRTLNDTVDFWILPLSYIVAAGIAVVILVVLLTAVIFRRTYPGYHTHKEKEGVIDLKNQR